MKATTFTLSLGGSEIRVSFVPNARAKRLSLKLDPYANEAKVTVPPYSSFAEAHDFLSQYHQWLAQKINSRGQKIPFSKDISIPILGQQYKISYEQADQPRVTLEDKEIFVQGFDEVVIAGLVKDWLRRFIYEKLHHHSQTYASQIGKKVKGVTLKEMKSRWGSCSASGNLVYNWRLVFAPYESMQYVCAHEVAHILEMNHSKNFWKIVESLYPNYKPHQQWLKKNSHQLFMYG